MFRDLLLLRGSGRKESHMAMYSQGEFMVVALQSCPSLSKLAAQQYSFPMTENGQKRNKKKMIVIHVGVACLDITQNHQTLFSPLMADFAPLEAAFLLSTRPCPGVLKNKLGPWPSCNKWLKYPLCAGSL